MPEKQLESDIRYENNSKATPTVKIQWRVIAHMKSSLKVTHTTKGNLKATHAMETNFESTYSWRQNTIRKARYAKKAALQASTTCHKNKQERRQTPQD